MSRPRALLLDLDDTILSYTAHGAPAWQRVCEKYAPDLDLEPGALRKIIDAAAREHWSDEERHRLGRLNLLHARCEILTTALTAADRDAGPWAAAMALDYHDWREDAVAPFPGALEALDKLRDLGLALALLTNGASEGQRKKIDRYELAPRFQAILVEEEFGVGKPHASVYLEALSRLGVAASDVWMVGDSLTADIKGAQSVGIHAVWNDYANRGLPEHLGVTPDRTITHISEVAEFLSQA
ncbi:MAG: HAD-IA family hydrolase [Planctomycetota bacterium]